MSTHRIRPDAGWILTTKEKGPNGRGLCRLCKTEVPKGCRTFCSEKCIHEWKIQTQPGYVRSLVARRDKGICAGCGLDTEKIERIAGSIRKHDGCCHTDWFWEAIGVKDRRWTGASLWQADRILEVVRGGGGLGLDNYQTLCTACHNRKSKRLAAERAEERRIAKELVAQPLFAGCRSQPHP